MVVILLGNGFEEAEALVPADLMRRAGIEVALTALADAPTSENAVWVTGGHGVTVKADQTLAEIDPEVTELIMLPGGLDGVRAIGSSPAALELVKKVHASGGRVAAICAAPTILARLGLLEGQKAVCYPGMEDQLTGAILQTGSPIVEDGPLITGEAAGAAFDFGLKLIEALRGADMARKVRDSVHYHG